MALLKLNRHTYFLDVNTVEVVKVSDGRWEVTFDGDRKFLVIGGRESGGSSREWFCYRPEMFGETWVPFTSKIAAIRAGCSY